MQRELEKQRRIQSNAVMRMLVKEANEGKRRLESELYSAEVREKREQVKMEEKKIRESMEKYRQIRESQNRGLRERRIEAEREKAIQTEEMVR